MPGLQPPDPLGDLVPVLQTAIGPVILISGVGLLLLSMTNRYGRVIDRSRELVRLLRLATTHDHARLLTEIEMLFRRARLLRRTITLAALSVLLAGLLVVTLFLAVLLRWETVVAIGVLFIASMTALCSSLVGFLLDLRISLAALRLEVQDARSLAAGAGDDADG